MQRRQTLRAIHGSGRGHQRELDRDLWVKFNGETLTYRTIFQGMIYSRFAHAKKRKHELFEKMATHPFGYMLAMDDFLRCVRVVHSGLLFVNKLNAAAFPHAPGQTRYPVTLTAHSVHMTKAMVLASCDL